MSTLVARPVLCILILLAFITLSLPIKTRAIVSAPIVATPADYDGDGKVDLSVKTDGGRWLIDYAANGFGAWDAPLAEYGGAGAVTVPADYDGDGKADLSVKLDDGHWLIDYATNGFGAWDATFAEYGGSGAVPVPADYDGDGKADLSVKLDDGHWLIDYATNGFGAWDATFAEYGGSGAVPVPADYDGDGKADLSVKLDDGHWLINYAANGFGAWDATFAEYGGAGAVPVPADYDGDGKADLSVKLDDGHWLINYAANGFGAWDATFAEYGGAGAVPVPADYDGDGKADLSVKLDDGHWLIDYAANGFGAWDATFAEYSGAGAVPVPQPKTPDLAPGIWNVPYYSQVDPQWSSQRFTNSKCDSIGKVGCAITSLAMIFKYYGVNHNPSTLSTCMGSAACDLDWGNPKIVTCSSGKIRWDARPAFSYARLEQELKIRPVILEISNNGALHFVVVLGGKGSDPKNYTVNDPGVRYGARTNLAYVLKLYNRMPSSIRLYSGTPALQYQLAGLQQTDTITPLKSPQPTADEPITGTLVLYRNTETEITLELAAQSIAGDVTEMQISTDAHPSDIWQPFSPYVSVPLDHTFSVQFRDAAGNTSSIISESVPSAPITIQRDVTDIYLPTVSK